MIYSKFDVIAIFNWLKIAKKAKWKIAFFIYYSLFEYVVLFSGFWNSPFLFQYYINNTLNKYLNIFWTTYLNAILIHSIASHEYKEYIKIILIYLKSANLFLDMTKYEFHITNVPYLGFIISTYKVKIDSTKIQKILK